MSLDAPIPDVLPTILEPALADRLIMLAQWRGRPVEEVLERAVAAYLAHADDALDAGGR